VLKKILGVIAGIGAMVIGLMFFMMAFAVIIVVALLVWAYFWWKTRKLRRTMQGQQGPSASGNVFEGEAVVVRKTIIESTNLLPEEATKEPPAPPRT
jgi:NADH:ubiquinone oxidoreductase subunit H